MSRLGLSVDGKIPWFRGTERGSWTSIALGLGGEATIALYFITLIFFGILTTYIQGVRGFGVGIFYMILIVIAILVWFIESTSPKTRAIAIIDLGPIPRWVVAVPIGIGLGVGFVVFLELTLGAFIPFENIRILGIPVELAIQILAPVVFIPIAEEAFFGGVLTPTIAESVGIIGAAVLGGLAWVMWHLGTYQTSFEVLVILFLFRIIATFVILYTKSLLPTILAHIVINFAGEFFTL